MKTLRLSPIVLLLSSLFCAMGQGASLTEKARAKLVHALKPHFPQDTSVEVTHIRPPPHFDSTSQIVGLLPSPPLGLVQVEWETTVNAQPLRSSTSAVVHAWARVAVAKTPLTDGQFITEEAVEFTRKELSALVRWGYFVDPKALVTRVAKGMVVGGQVIGLSNTRINPTVRPGMTVNLVRDNGSVRLVGSARVLQRGNVNDWVQVQNTRSGRVVLARVASAAEVEVP